MRRAAVFLGCVVAGAGCAAPPVGPARWGQRPALHVVPAASEAQSRSVPRYFPPPIWAQEEDAVVRVVGPQMTCTGTLVDEDLVLTAHHCVVQRGPHGEFTKTVVSPSDLHIELGGDYLAWGTVGVKHIVRPRDKDGVPCGEQGRAGDVAILVLPRKLVGLGVIPPRLDGAPQMREKLRPIGFGRCAMSDDGIRRHDREGLPEDGIRRRDRSSPKKGGVPIEGLTPEAFWMRASICPGDSGGPVLSGTDEVVGVISVSAMDGDDRTRDASIMARVDAMRALFSNARQVADGASESELPPVACSH